MSNCLLVETNEQLKKTITSLKDEKFIACDLEASELNITVAKLEGIGFGTTDRQFFIPFPNGFSEEQISDALVTIFKNKRVIFHNAKYDLALMKENGLPLPEAFDDTMIMSWLVDEDSQHGLKPLSKAILGREPKKWVELNKTVTLFRTDDDIIEELADYCGDDVMNTYDLYFYFKGGRNEISFESSNDLCFINSGLLAGCYSATD